jgi:hypothetical protein
LKDNISNIKKNTENLTDVSKEVDLEVHAEETKYVLMSFQQNAEQSQIVKILVANRSFANAAKFKYLGRTLTNQNLIHEEIKSRLNSGNEVQKLLCSRLPSKNIEIKTHKTIILPAVLYGFETWSLKLREEYKLAVFENRALRRTFGPKWD